MASSYVKFEHSLDYLEQTYSNFIREKLPNYIIYWEEYVGVYGTERGRLIGYKLTFREGPLNEFQKSLKNKFDTIRKTTYSILIQTILVENINRSQFYTEDYIESIECIQNLTNNMTTIHHYLNSIWGSLSNILKKNKKHLEEFDD